MSEKEVQLQPPCNLIDLLDRFYFDFEQFIVLNLGQYIKSIKSSSQSGASFKPTTTTVRAEINRDNSSLSHSGKRVI